MKYLIIVFAIALSGCVPEEQEPCNTKYSHGDTVGKTGLMLKATSEAFVPFSRMETMYREMEACLGLTAPPPTIEYVDFGGGWGIWMAPNTTIWINVDVGIAPRNCISDQQTLKHEYTHHILYMNGKDYNHSSPEFERCGVLGVNTCNGVPCA